MSFAVEVLLLRYNVQFSYNIYVIFQQTKIDIFGGSAYTFNGPNFI